jgi:hypothetical protein
MGTGVSNMVSPLTKHSVIGLAPDFKVNIEISMEIIILEAASFRGKKFE